MWMDVVAGTVAFFHGINPFRYLDFIYIHYASKNGRRE
jgi:hypothetical protein